MLKLKIFCGKDPKEVEKDVNYFTSICSSVREIQFRGELHCSYTAGVIYEVEDETND